MFIFNFLYSLIRECWEIDLKTMKIIYIIIVILSILSFLFYNEYFNIIEEKFLKNILLIKYFFMFLFFNPFFLIGLFKIYKKIISFGGYRVIKEYKGKEHLLYNKIENGEKNSLIGNLGIIFLSSFQIVFFLILEYLFIFLFKDSLLGNLLGFFFFFIILILVLINLIGSINVFFYKKK